MPSADFCSVVRLPPGSLSPLRTQSRSPGVSSTAFRAQSPDVRFASLMDMDFAVTCPLARCWHPVFVHRLARLLYASFRPRLTAIALAFSLALHLHQVGQGTLTPKLLSMPSTQVSRWRGGRFACAKGRGPCSLAGRLLRIAHRV